MFQARILTGLPRVAFREKEAEHGIFFTLHCSTQPDIQSCTVKDDNIMIKILLRLLVFIKKCWSLLRALGCTLQFLKGRGLGKFLEHGLFPASSCANLFWALLRIFLFSLSLCMNLFSPFLQCRNFFGNCPSPSPHPLELSLH